MTAEPRDVKGIRADLGDLAVVLGDLAGVCSTQSRIEARAIRNSIRTRLAADVEPLLARLAAADRENAELRAVIAATASDVERYVADRLADARQENAELRGEVERLRNELENETEDRRAAEQSRDAAHAVRENFRATNDDLRAQLAAAQAQLAEARAQIEQQGAWLETARKSNRRKAAKHNRLEFARRDAEARLEAVRAIADELLRVGVTDTFKIAHRLRAVLSAAPQPEPVCSGSVAVDLAVCECHAGQPTAEVYQCRYGGGLHRRKPDGSLWNAARAARQRRTGTLLPPLWCPDVAAPRPAVPPARSPMTRPDATLDQLRTLIDLANERHLHDAEQWLRERVEAAEERMGVRRS